MVKNQVLFCERAQQMPYPAARRLRHREREIFVNMFAARNDRDDHLLLMWYLSTHAMRTLYLSKPESSMKQIDCCCVVIGD